ncbi:MAG: glycerol-3-phosphate acyltransferase [Anaerolineae bacterium]|nr:glycerol-3-phosphate acyltransferase [Anaerolineae bacterium]NUQ06249.1 glycerol-3-phosphate acyltransferase [Anaerolineae bacterium]
MNETTAQTLLWTGIGFAAGSLMLAYWLGWLALRRDVRQIGDGNPGATNVLKAGGWQIGALALLLDVLKGAIPVSIATYVVGLSGAPLALAALAPVFGHAFSPFLRFKGGKAVAVSFGVWMALTLWELPSFGGILLGVWFSLIAVSGWAVLMTFASLIAYLLIAHPDPVLIAVLAVNGALVAWKYRDDLRRFPQPRAWLAARLKISEL